MWLLIVGCLFDAVQADCPAGFAGSTCSDEMFTLSNGVLQSVTQTGSTDYTWFLMDTGDDVEVPVEFEIDLTRGCAATIYVKTGYTCGACGVDFVSGAALATIDTFTTSDTNPLVLETNQRFVSLHNNPGTDMSVAPCTCPGGKRTRYFATRNTYSTACTYGFTVRWTVVPEILYAGPQSITNAPRRSTLFLFPLPNAFPGTLTIDLEGECSSSTNSKVLAKYNCGVLTGGDCAREFASNFDLDQSKSGSALVITDGYTRDQCGCPGGSEEWHITLWNRDTSKTCTDTATIEFVNDACNDRGLYDGTSCTCQQGYTSPCAAVAACPTGSSTIGPDCNCDDTGFYGTPVWGGSEWTHTCSVYECTAPPEAPANGAVAFSDGDAHGSVATLTCEAGYSIGGVTTATCDSPSSSQDWPAAVATCTDIDECLATNDCDAEATCADTDGSYTCTCNEGYTGDGVTCTDIDECLATNDCDAEATCVDTDGSYTCTCNEGYTGDGVTCTVVPCPANTVGTSPDCTCSQGYRGLAWESGAWTTCDAEDCPVGSVGAPPACDCAAAGYTGEVAWDPVAGWTHTCIGTACDTHTCSRGTRPNPAAAADTCPGGVCTDALCCLENPTCSSVICSSTLPVSMGDSWPCVAEDCGEPECCTAGCGDVGMAYSGTVIGSDPAANPTVCREACVANTACAHFSFGADGRCELLSSKGAASAEAGVYSGARVCDDCLMAGWLIEGADVGSGATVSTAAECQVECLKEATCVGWYFDTRTGSTCQLKSSTDGATAAANVVSGRKTCEAYCGLNPACTSFSGDPLRSCGEDCSDTECCASAALLCSSHTCEAGQVVLPEDESSQCAADPCTDVECCSDMPSTTSTSGTDATTTTATTTTTTTTTSGDGGDGGVLDAAKDRLNGAEIPKVTNAGLAIAILIFIVGLGGCCVTLFKQGKAAPRFAEKEMGLLEEGHKKKMIEEQAKSISTSQPKY